MDDSRAKTKVITRPVPGLAMAELRAAQKRTEKVILGLSGLFVVIVISIAIFTEGTPFAGTLRFLRSFESADANAGRNRAQNCMDPRNKNMPYCQNRQAELDSDWRSIERVQGGKSPAFSIRGR